MRSPKIFTFDENFGKTLMRIYTLKSRCNNFLIGLKYFLTMPLKKKTKLNKEFKIFYNKICFLDKKIKYNKLMRIILLLRN